MIDGIYEFTFRPVANKKNAITVFTVMMALALSAVAASAMAEKYKGLISLLAVGLICAAIYLFTRYVGAEYSYVVAHDSEENPNLIVTKTVGKRVTTLFNIPLYEIVDIRRESPKERAAHKTPFGVKKFNYAVTLMAGDTYRLITKSRTAENEIILEITREVADRLLEYSKLARAKENEGE